MHHRRMGSDRLTRNQDGERLFDVIWPLPAARNFKTLPVCGSPGSALTVLAVLLYLSRRELLPAPEPLCVLPGIVCICAGLTPSLDVSARVLPLPVSSPSSLQLLPPFLALLLYSSAQQLLSPHYVLRCCLIYVFSPTLKFKQCEDRPVSVAIVFLVPRTVSGPAGELPGMGAWGRVRRVGRWLCHGDFQPLPLDLPSLSQDLRQEESVIRLHIV